MHLMCIYFIFTNDFTIYLPLFRVFVYITNITTTTNYTQRTICIFIKHIILIAAWLCVSSCWLLLFHIQRTATIGLFIYLCGEVIVYNALCCDKIYRIWYILSLSLCVFRFCCIVLSWTESLFGFAVTNCRFIYSKSQNRLCTTMFSSLMCHQHGICLM